MSSFSQRALISIAAMSLVGIGLTACGGSDSASDSASSSDSSSSTTAPTDMAGLYEEAKSEGTVVLWGGEDPDEIQGAFDKFSETYPGLKLEFTAVNPDGQAAALAQASAAGQPLPDIIQGRREYMPTLVDGGFIADDPGWESLGADPSIVSGDGGLIEYKSLYVLAYNTSMVSDSSTLPSSWEALDDKKYAGQLSIDPRGFPFNVLAASLGTDKTVDYVSKLKGDVKPAIIQGGTAGMTQLAAGAQAMRPAAREDVEVQKANGAPIDFVVPEPALIQDTLWYEVKDSPHAAAAELFALWFTSADGGQAITLEQDHRDNQLPAEAEGMTVVDYATEDQAATVADATAKIAEVWGS